MQFRVLTYNIHKGIGGVDRRYRLERIVETIAHYEADLVLLQEVDDGVPRSRNDRQAELLAEKLGYPHFAFQRNVHLKRGFYGNAILSQHRLFDTSDVDLSIPLKKRRQALVSHVKLDCDGHRRTITLANIHLGLSGIERSIQLRLLLGHPLLTRHAYDAPILVGGDFNDVWGSLGKRIMEPAGYLPAGKMIRTFPARFPLRPLDHIFSRGTLAPVNAFAGHTKLARVASDHLPLVADMELGL